jgi:hypothetical protein
MLRYYPSFRIKTGLITNGSQYRTSSGPYKGKYYITYDGRKFTGENPIVGPNEELVDISADVNSTFLNSSNLPNSVKSELIQKSGNSIKIRSIGERGAPVPYFPFATEADYKKGYLLRSFLKKVNDKGFVIEISNEEYANFSNGIVDYDVSDYLSLQILWKLTGPLNTVRLSQYDIRSGIIDTNKRLVENANKTFLGITDFIGGDYTKFSRPTL